MSTPVSRNVTLRQMRAFVKVAQVGSFSRAADLLGISQPALTLGGKLVANAQGGLDGILVFDLDAG